MVTDSGHSVCHNGVIFIIHVAKNSVDFWVVTCATGEKHVSEGFQLIFDQSATCLQPACDLSLTCTSKPPTWYQVFDWTKQ